MTCIAGEVFFFFFLMARNGLSPAFSLFFPRNCDGEPKRTSPPLFSPCDHRNVNIGVLSLASRPSEHQALPQPRTDARPSFSFQPLARSSTLPFPSLPFHQDARLLPSVGVPLFFPRRELIDPLARMRLFFSLLPPPPSLADFITIKCGLGFLFPPFPFLFSPPADPEMHVSLIRVLKAPLYPLSALNRQN